MNLHQVLNSGAFFFVTASLIAGIGSPDLISHKSPVEILENHHQKILFAIFYVILRAKMTFDDHRYYGSPVEDKDLPKTIGFLLAILSWVIWSLSGYTILNLKFSAAFLAFSILISSIWIIVHLIGIGSRFIFRNSMHPMRTNEKALLEKSSRTRLKWLGINMVYFALLISIFLTKVANLEVIALISCIFVLIFDIVTSKSFDDKPNNLTPRGKKSVNE